MIRVPRRRRAGLLSASLALVLLPAGMAGQAVAAGPDGGGQAAARTSAEAAARPTATAHAAHTVTLVTGDKVTITDLGQGRKTVSVERPKGATGAVRTETTNGRITVIPDEALPYLNAGVLDARLFDVSELIRQGFADGDKGAADGLPLIVTYGKSARTAPSVPRGAEKVRSLPSVGGAAVRAGQEREFWRSVAPQAVKPAARAATSDGARFADGIEKIWLDGRVKGDMAESNAQIGTPQAWESGLTGKDVKVAVLDTGVDAGHPDLTGRVSQSKSFIEGQEVADRNGHGTHVTSTIGGTGAASDSKEKGVAPDATLAVGKVLSDQGSGSESQIIAGMEWAARDVHAKVVSMSLGSREGSDGTDPMAQAVNTLSKETGALFVIAAGNSGAPGSIGSPGAADSALTVGAVDSADRAAYFSSQGPRFGDNALKPDVSAPGVGILAARSQLTSGSGYYTSLSGTSMATPHVAGVAALLAQKHPDWSGAQLKDALMSTSKQLGASAYALGAGRVSVPAAITARITATGSADLGFYGWPYADNKPVTKTLTYANSSDQPVELSLAAQGAPDGVVSLADALLTVPAHGTASTTVTGDGAKAAVGNTGGQIVASADGAPVAHTAFGLVKEDERYTLTVHVKDRDGAATGAYLVLQQLAKGIDPSPAQVGDSGTLKLRLKPGTYSVTSFLKVRGSHGADSLGLGFLAAPEVILDQDREVTLDGRQLKEISAKVDQRTETRQLAMEYDRKANGADLLGAIQVPPTYDSIFAAPTDKVTDGTFEYRTTWRLGKPLLVATVGDKPLSDATVQPGSALTDGHSTVSVVDAGSGVPADYTGKDVHGKAVIVHATSAISPAVLAQTAQDAGAKALFVTDDQPGRLMAWFGNADYTGRSLLVATVSAADGAQLIDAAKTGERIHLTTTRNSPYIYDLSDSHPGAIPDNLTYAPNASELARVDDTFYAVKPIQGSEVRASLTDTFPVAVGFPELIDYPAKRTGFVTADHGLKWHQSAWAASGALEERNGLATYRGGTRSQADWFKPIWHPWLGTGLGWGQQRAGNALQFNVPGWGDSGPDHTGFGDVYRDPSLQQTTEVYADGKLVDRRKWSAAYDWNADPAEHTYKVVTDTALDPARWKLSTKGHSEWTVKSAETPADRWTYLPLLNLGFNIDTDIAGNVRAGHRLPVGIYSEYYKRATGTGTIGDGTLQVSYDDGQTWTSVGLERDGRKAAWSGTLNVPADAQYISVRATAGDDQGGKVTQEIIRAVGVK
ncbi:S8 family serine peptidase [Streptomyces sp. NPDC051020]|uniref:S8 family serine peptidase n=1 Tax=Streptomyces sp. NPDC051020 TaxID=3155409 RepID=UPI00344537C6